MLAEQNKRVLRFEAGVGVDRSKMRREGVPNRGASMPKTTRGESNLGTRLGEKIDRGGAKLTCWGVAKMTNIEGKHYGGNGELKINSLPNRKPMKRI